MADDQTPATPAEPSPARVWATRALGGVVLVGLLYLGVFGLPEFIGRQMRVDGGQIFVHGPQVYTRERLVNDRYQEDSWLNKMLEESPDQKFGYTAARGSVERKRTEGGVAAGGDTQPSATPSPATPPPGTPPTGTRTPGNGATADGQGLPDIAEQPTFKLQATRAYREQIRTMLIENQLDDRHDLHGNTLYRLRFDATILPTERSESAAQIEITIQPEGLAPARGVAVDARKDEKSDVKQPDERDKVLSGKATFDELTRWLDKWEDLYGRWRGSLEQRFEEEAVARSRSYESGRFGPDDYDVLLGRLRTSVLQRAKQIGDVVKLFEDSGPLAVGALPPPPGVAAGQTSATDKLSQCISEVYRGAAKELKEMQARKELGLLVFPIANQSDPVEKDTEKLKNFREAFLLGVMESGEFIEKHPFHEIYRDRIRTLLILRRDLLQLGDISRCNELLPSVNLVATGAAQTAALQRPAPVPPTPSGAAPPPAPPPSAAIQPTAAPAPPPAAVPLPPPAASSPAPPAAGPAPDQPAAGLPLPAAPAPDQPAAGLPLPAAPAPVQPGALATVPPTPGSVVGQPTAGPPPAAGPPPPPGVAQTLVQAQPTGLVRTNAQQAQVPFIDATQLQRRLLDSEFWPRIYKAATGVDDPMDNIDDLMPAGGIALVTPPSLKSLARVTWDPQRKRRAFQVSERVEALRVASQRECLVAMTLDAPEALTVEVEGGKTQTLFVSPPVSKRLKEEAPNLKLEILLRYASTQLAERTKQQALLSRVQRVNPCDFQIVPIDVPVGLFNFAVRLSEAREIYTYAISPTEPDELIANRMRADMMREFGMQAAMKNLAQSGVDAGARLKAEEEMSKFARFDTVQRSVFGYGEKGEQARVGWQILPRDHLPAGGGSDRLYLAPRQIPMTALLSLPAWWDKIRLTVRRSWVDRRGREHEISPSAPPYVIDLPTNFETLDASLLRNADTTGPVLVDWQMPRMAIRPCQPFSVTLIGRRLWRSTVVTLAGARADRVVVMPNMNGIIASFVRAPRPGNLPDRQPPDRDGKAQHFYAQLTVWTSQGSVNLPRLIKFELPEAAASPDPACKAGEPVVKLPPG